MGAEVRRVAETPLGKSVVLVDVQEGYRLWSGTYDRDPNPVLALERRVIRERLGPLSGRCVLDIATGTGFWLEFALSRGARAFGIDLSHEMLAAAASKPGLRNHLIRGDMKVLPIKDAVADVAICSLAVGYLPSIRNLFRELARVARRVIVSDLHETAVQSGWRRCFEAEGCRYEIQHYEHSVAELDEMAKSAGLRVDWRVASRLAEPERPFFVQAGREYAFEAASQIPAVLSTCWTNS